MGKELSEMTNEELWRLFPIILTEHDPSWADRYKRESAVVARTIGNANIARISHIGSTSVPGLTAKPTIDILAEITHDCDTGKLIANMEAAGYIYSPQPENPPPHMMFMKGYTPQGFKGQVYHVHVRYGGDWNELYFRDYLRDHKAAANEYGKLKTSLRETFEHDRDGYTDAKSDFINRYTELARVEYKDRYELKEE